MSLIPHLQLVQGVLIFLFDILFLDFIAVQALSSPGFFSRPCASTFRSSRVDRALSLNPEGLPSRLAVVHSCEQGQPRCVELP